MSQRIHVHQNGTTIYDICLEHSFDRIAEELRSLQLENRRICIVTDSHVAPLHLDALEKELKTVSSELISFVMPAGEAHKNLDTVRNLYETLIQAHFERRDLLVALGGGVVGDLTGFAAATYLRGIDFIQVPTTLLAQVDSSIGGKTGVDFSCYKNMVGAFKMPRLVYMNLSTLQTLDRRIYLSGMGEIVKHALIRDAAYLEWIETHTQDILDRNPEALEEMIAVSCRIKRDVVEEDPTEKGVRAILNMGHTLGHAIEKQAGFSLYHGECVSIGCVASAVISRERGLITEAEFNRIRDAFAKLDLPVSVSNLNAEAVLSDVRNDKKMEAGVVKFILLQSIGNAEIDRTVTFQEMEQALREVGVCA